MKNSKRAAGNLPAADLSTKDVCEGAEPRGRGRQEQGRREAPRNRQKGVGLRILAVIVGRDGTFEKDEEVWSFTEHMEY